MSGDACQAHDLFHICTVSPTRVAFCLKHDTYDMPCRECELTEEKFHASMIEEEKSPCDAGTCDCTGADEVASRVREMRLTQVGGAHYIKYAIQPFDIIDCYGLSFYEGSALKYLLRYRDKNGVEDLKKARHYIDVLIEKAEAHAG